MDADFKISLDKLGGELLKKFAREIIDQGHNNTGSLISSFRKDLLFAASSYSLAFYANDYGWYLETGRKPKARRVPVDALIKWVAQKGMASTNKEARSIAFAIQAAIYKEGSPTRGAYDYTFNKRRTYWITKTVRENTDLISTTINRAFKNSIKTTMNNIIRQTNTKLK